MQPLENTRVLLIVGGGIAAYKAPLVVRALIAAGADVRCVMTASAGVFVTPMALQTVSQHRVASNLLDTAQESEIGHIELARWADVVLVAPATANLLARMAAGMANDLATTVLLATTAPVLVAPAMNTQMLGHPATQRNLETLRSFGVDVIPADSGALACNEVGEGRQPDPIVLVDAVGRLRHRKPLAGKRVLISAGPTRAFLDPVRFVTNPSTGKMGVALAHAVDWLGGEAILVAGPGVQLPEGMRLSERVDVETAEAMADAVLSRVPEVDWIFMAAAVRDYTPSELLTKKRKKDTTDHDETWTVTFERTRDILKLACEQARDMLQRPVVVGFAAETHDLEAHARAKLGRKGCDVILGNWVRSNNGDTFGSDTVALQGFGHDGWSQSFGPAHKFMVSLEVLEALVEQYGPRPEDT